MSHLKIHNNIIWKGLKGPSVKASVLSHLPSLYVLEPTSLAYVVKQKSMKRQKSAQTIQGYQRKRLGSGCLL